MFLRKKDVYFKYSIEEQWTGEYWLDGKKIYSKVIQSTGVLSSAGVVNIKHDIILKISCQLIQGRNLVK